MSEFRGELGWEALCDIGAKNGSDQPKNLYISPNINCDIARLVRIKPYGMLQLELRYKHLKEEVNYLIVSKDTIESRKVVVFNKLGKQKRGRGEG